jgi:hypothetical protein
LVYACNAEKERAFLLKERSTYLKNLQTLLNKYAAAEDKCKAFCAQFRKNLSDWNHATKELGIELKIDDRCSNAYIEKFKVDTQNTSAPSLHTTLTNQNHSKATTGRTEQNEEAAKD